MTKTAADLAAAYALIPDELRAARKIAPVKAEHTVDTFYQPDYDADSLTCSLLAPDGSCRIYAARPTICRLWGTVRKLACPHGCLPERWLTDEEAAKILDAVERAGRR